MASIRKSVIVHRPAALMYGLVEDIESYPQFLPWCTKTTVLERSPEVTVARMDLDYHGLKSHITTRNSKSPPEAMALDLVDGPFRALSGKWRFVPLGEEGSRVELQLDYEFANRAFELALGAAFGYIMGTLMDRFVQRAESMPEPGSGEGA